MAKKKKVEEPIAEPVGEPVKDVTTPTDDDFTDSHPAVSKPEPAPAPEPVKEEPKAAEAAPAKVEEPVSYTYDDPNLQTVEDARNEFFKKYKHDNLIKLIVSIAVVVCILAGWIIPFVLMPNSGNTSLIIALSIAGAAVIGLGIYSYFFRKHADNGIKEYFKKYYDASYAYATEDLKVEGYHADLDTKLDLDEFKACGMYDDVYKVGSRYAVTFKYQGADCAIEDAASQVKGKKALETSFVGKYLRMPNTYEGTGLVIYFKGNDRALPPSCIKRLNCIEDSQKFSVYGDNEEKRYLTHKIRMAFAQVVTNKTLVDVAISIKPGRTYICLGYEDDLMVIPLQKAFNPGPTKEFKANLKEFLDLGLLFNGTK